MIRPRALRNNEAIPPQYRFQRAFSAMKAAHRRRLEYGQHQAWFDQRIGA